MPTPPLLQRDPSNTLLRIVGVMYVDGSNTGWDAGTIERVAEVLNAANLVPTEARDRHSRTFTSPNSWTHRRAACEHALASLAAIRNLLGNAGARQAKQAIARAMKSVDGARRHAHRFEHQSIARSARDVA